MPEQIPERADVRQLRTQAKELLRSLQADSATAHSRLADAQLLVARKYGFESWPKLVAQVETPALIEKLKTAIEDGDAGGLEKLLQSKPSLRRTLNDPMFAFDSQPLLRASNHPEAAKLLPILVRFGADPNIRSKWWAGGFGALELANAKTSEILVKLGAKYDVWSAAAQGKLDILRALLEENPAAVNAPGGDGQTPLHFAATPEVAELLIEKGADLEQRDVDHESTPIQHQINNTDVVRVLLRHGAKPDIFTAVALDDVEIFHRVIKEDSSAVEAHVGAAPFNTTKSDGGHTYTYQIGPTKTPFQMAIERGSRSVLEELQRNFSPARRLIVAAWAEDADSVAAILREHPGIAAEIGPDSRAISDAAQAGKTETVRLLLDAGADPTVPGMDSGSALHIASWFGYPEIVKLLIGHVPLDLKDANHGSPPLGWATHGAQWCRNPAGDYVSVVRMLLAAGAEFTVPANSQGDSMLAQAGKREDIKKVLREFGAV